MHTAARVSSTGCTASTRTEVVSDSLTVEIHSPPSGLNDHSEESCTTGLAKHGPTSTGTQIHRAPISAGPRDPKCLRSTVPEIYRPPEIKSASDPQCSRSTVPEIHRASISTRPEIYAPEIHSAQDPQCPRSTGPKIHSAYDPQSLRSTGLLVSF
ncbi:unnamed protein product [Pleuronectes platessa]|uniref:Uncharacterized protein n=1 Tax=Pleuronectes platessa TaxID=8262 RepID=A0A9N7Y9G0_PLEPL|nr:unnamed protein product [Pleuronectes platessa]